MQVDARPTRGVPSLLAPGKWKQSVPDQPTYWSVFPNQLETNRNLFYAEGMGWGNTGPANDCPA